MQLEAQPWKKLFKDEAKYGWSYLEIWLNMIKIKNMIVKNQILMNGRLWRLNIGEIKIGRRLEDLWDCWR